MGKKKYGKKQQQGSMLLGVLILGGLMTCIAMMVVEMSLLQVRMIHNHQMKLNGFKQVENSLIAIEEKVYEHAELIPGVTYKQFVPDTLLFGEKAGVKFYEVTVRKTNEQGVNVDLQAIISTR